MSKLSRLIRRYRLARDMSLRELGDAASVHYSYVGKLERGTVDNPSRDVVRRIAVALSAPVDEFEIAAGYIPESSTVAASRRDGYDNSLPPDVLEAVEVILDELRRRHRNEGKDN